MLPKPGLIAHRFPVGVVRHLRRKSAYFRGAKADNWRERAQPVPATNNYNKFEQPVAPANFAALLPMSSPAPHPGKVYLVGAGPGDPGLITLRGMQCLERADAVLYDYLVNPRLLAGCRPGTEIISLGKHGGGRIWSQEEINEALVRLARQGKTVVRLKGGDPVVFARGVEEIEALTAAGIPFEIVPGITAALAAGSYAGIPITHRELASAVALVTGHEDCEKEGPPLDYARLAAFPGTLVFYMGVTTAAHWSSDLMAAGKLPQTPVAVIRRVSFPDQKVWHTTLGEIAAVVARTTLRPPVIFVVGEVASLAPTLSWFDKRPLFGQSVLVTRPNVVRRWATGPTPPDDFADRLAELGAEVFYQPAIEIRPPDDWSAVDAALARLREFDWLVFSSVNGVDALLRRLLQSVAGTLRVPSPDDGTPTHFVGAPVPATYCDLRALAGVKIAAIGIATAARLAAYHLRADLVPDEFRAEALAESLAADARGKRFLLARASRGREVLAETLSAAGGIVEQVVVYQSIDVQSPDPDIASRLAAGRINWTTVTSSAIARSLARLFGDDLRKTKLVSISPITSGTLREVGYEPAAEAKEYTMEGVVEAIATGAQQKGG
jgi:uroporphyrinogen III methyltransferase/synthase